MNKNNSHDKYFSDNYKELPLFLQLTVARIKSHFELSILPGLINKTLEEAYTKDELIEICELLSQLEDKLSDADGNYRQLT